MVKFAISFVFLSLLCLNANQIEVSANEFKGDELSGRSVLSGNVLVKRDKDILRSEKLVIYTDKKRQPIKFVATGNANFELFLKDKAYKGKGDEFIYHAKSDSYEIKGNAFIEELTTKKRLYGNTIFVDRKKQTYSISGSKDKPARFIFELEQK